LRQDGPHAITWLGQPETRFTFDHVAGENISQVRSGIQFSNVVLPSILNYSLSLITNKLIGLSLIFPGESIQSGWIAHRGELHGWLQ
jgi:hypothetical protein